MYARVIVSSRTTNAPCFTRLEYGARFVNTLRALKRFDNKNDATPGVFAAGDKNTIFPLTRAPSKKKKF